MPLIPFIKGGGYFASRVWLPFVRWNGLTTSGGEGEEPDPGIIRTVTGFSPITLIKALAHSILSITQFGKCVQDGTPTPDAPVDIVCNNGTLRYGAMGNNLYDPSTAVFTVGYYYNPNADGAQTAAQNNFIYHAYIPIEAGAAYVFYGRRKDDNRISQYNRIHFYDAEKTYISTNTYTAGTIGKGVAPENAVYAKLSCNPQGANTAISAETVLGYNWTFCKGTAEITPFVPFVGGVYPDGTPETLTIVHNLYDPNGVDPNHYYSPEGVYTETQTVKLSNRVPVKSGDVIVCTTKAVGTGGEINIRYNQLDTNGEWVSQEVQSQPRNTTRTKSVTINQDGFFCFSGAFTGTTYVDFDATVIFIESETQTVSVPMLLGVGDYKDSAELISGIKTGKVGVKVFDGTESWTAYTSSTLVVNNATSDWGAVAGVGGYCTHLTVLKAGETTFAGSCRFATAFNLYEYKTAFGVADVAGFKAKLASEYANGTPVIVLYPLATPTTEQTTPHSLHTTEGTVVVDAQTNVDPVTLTCEYKGVADDE